MKKRGREPGYKKWEDPHSITLLQMYAVSGLSMEEIAEKLNISKKTLYEWSKKSELIGNALKKGRDEADYEVENALYKKALGYTVIVKKAFKVKKIEYEDGRKLKEYEEIIMADDEIHIPADTLAQIYWLKNRKPLYWRDKPVVIEDDADTGVIEIAAISEEAE